MLAKVASSIAANNGGCKPMGRKKPVILSTIAFETQSAAAAHFQDMLRKYNPGDRVSEKDGKQLESLLSRHPRANEKIGTGIDHFEVIAAEYNSQCFCAVRIDGTMERFSYKTCINITSPG